MTTSRGEARIEHRLSEGIPPPPTGASLPPEIVMRKGHAPFVFSACLVALVALVACSGDGTTPPAQGGAGNSGGGSPAENEAGTGELDGGGGGRGRQGFIEGG